MADAAATYPFNRGQFICKECQGLFYAEKGEVEDEDGVWWAKCPECGADAIETHYMRNLHKTIGSAKGAAMSPEGREKTRLNSFLSGATSKNPWHKGRIPMPPAKPGKYAECDGCQDLEACKAQVEEKLSTCIPVYCHRKGEVTLKYTAAFLADDPEMMRLMAAGNAAKMQMLFNDSIKRIFDRGTECVEEFYERNKAGDIQKDEFDRPIKGEKIYAHPLIKRCIEIMQVMGFSLTDWTMTPKSKEAKDQVAGFLAGMSAGSGLGVEEVTTRTMEAIDDFTRALQGAREMRARDKTLEAFTVESGQREGGMGE